MTSVHEPLRISVGTLSFKNPVICASGEHVMTEAGIRVRQLSKSKTVNP